LLKITIRCRKFVTPFFNMIFWWIKLIWFDYHFILFFKSIVLLFDSTIILSYLYTRIVYLSEMNFNCLFKKWFIQCITSCHIYFNFLYQLTIKFLTLAEFITISGKLFIFFCFVYIVQVLNTHQFHQFPNWTKNNKYYFVAVRYIL